MSQEPTGDLNVKAAAQLSGVNPHALRAWERRYQVVTPRRSTSGRRLYSLEDVQKLKVLGQLTGLGHSISSLALLDISQLNNLLNHERVPVAAETGHLLQISNQLPVLISAIKAFDLEKLDRQLIRLRLNLPLTALVLEIFSPLLSEIGTLVEGGELDVAQEHLLSTTLRNHLSDLLAQVQKTFVWNDADPNPLPRLLLTTAEGDFHEFGILLSALLAGNLGFKFRYMGPNMPAANLAKTALQLGADIIIIGSTPRNDNGLETFLSSLHPKVSAARDHPRAIWIGGACTLNLKAIKSRVPMVHFSTLQSFYRELCSLLSTGRRGMR